MNDHSSAQRPSTEQKAQGRANASSDRYGLNVAVSVINRGVGKFRTHGDIIGGQRPDDK